MMVGAWAFADVIDPRYGDAPQCSLCRTYVAGKLWLPPHRVRLVEGTKTTAPGDVIGGPGIDARASLTSWSAGLVNHRDVDAR